MSYKIQVDDVVRNATKEEIAEIETREQEATEQAKIIDAKNAAIASARAKLAALGLTADEIAAFLG